MRRFVMVVATLLLLAACGESTRVGEGVDLNFEEQVEGPRLGETTTTAPPVTAQPSQQAAIGQRTTAPPQTAATAPPTTEARRLTFDVAINSDTSPDGQFSPSQARVYVGYEVVFTNRDTQARSVVADQGAFSSPMLQPGQSWIYKANEPGTFNYHDGTRPYAVGLIEVLPR